MEVCPGCGGAIRLWRGVKGLEWAGKSGFSGTLRDTLGRTFCFRDGKRIACPEKDDDKAPPEEEGGDGIQAQDEESAPAPEGEEPSTGRVATFPLEGGFPCREPTGAVECDWYYQGGTIKGLAWYAVPSLDRLNREVRNGKGLERSDYLGLRALFATDAEAGEGCAGLDLRFSPEATQAYLDTYVQAAQTGAVLSLKGFTPLVAGHEAIFGGNVRLLVRFGRAIKVGEDYLLDDGCAVRVLDVLEAPWGFDVAMETVDAEAGVEGADGGGELPGEPERGAGDQRGGDAGLPESGGLPGGAEAGDDE